MYIYTCLCMYLYVYTEMYTHTYIAQVLLQETKNQEESQEREEKEKWTVECKVQQWQLLEMLMGKMPQYSQKRWPVTKRKKKQSLHSKMLMAVKNCTPLSLISSS